MSVRVCASVCVYGVRYVCEDGGTEDDNHCDGTETESDEAKKEKTSALRSTSK
jgi:hypothetical protein